MCVKIKIVVTEGEDSAPSAGEATVAALEAPPPVYSSVVTEKEQQQEVAQEEVCFPNEDSDNEEEESLPVFHNEEEVDQEVGNAENKNCEEPSVKRRKISNE